MCLNFHPGFGLKFHGPGLLGFCLSFPGFCLNFHPGFGLNFHGPGLPGFCLNFHDHEGREVSSL